MKAMMERDEFASVKTRKEELTVNWRSAGALVEFTKEVFHTRVPAHVPVEMSDLSGLASYMQEVKDDAKGKGYVEVHVMEPPARDDEVRNDDTPERQHVIRILNSCRERGYGFGDITILTPRNSDVVEVSRWLNAEGIKFLSHSSLDIRTRKTTGELLALLRFLDSPVDHHALSTFLLGELFGKLAKEDVREFIRTAHAAAERDKPLYSLFRARYPKLWERYFERLFALVGYLPLYDLIVEVYRIFDLRK
jgi:ATP-dependent exoDNAse (exonuclease V) beta subunit